MLGLILGSENLFTLNDERNLRNWSALRFSDELKIIYDINFQSFMWL